MDKGKVLASITEIKSDTAVKAWVFEVDKQFFHVASYRGFRVGDQTAIWTSNKRGKRISKTAVFTIQGNDHIKCVNDYIASLEHQS